MFKKIKTFFELIKFEHTAFALPFAYLGMMLARKSWPPWRVFWLVTLAMVSARTAGMTLNRIIDLKIDAMNPRTKDRPILSGEFPLWAAWIAAALALVIFFAAARMLNPLCFKCSFAAIVFLSGYHYVKRFSSSCHFVLGSVLAIAPMGGWLAVTGKFSWMPVPLSLAVLFWAAGFDVIYSLQDLEFDRAHGIHSIPAKFGAEAALKASGVCHLLTGAFLVLFGVLNGLGPVYWVGVFLTAVLLFIEHKIVADGDLSKVDVAFFTMNGWIGILLLIFTFLETFR